MKIFILSAILIITACTTVTQNNGAEIRQVKLDQIDEDSNKADVFNLLGSPSTKSVYGQETWYYITSKIKRRLLQDDKILSQSVIAISFDGDKVDNVQVYDSKDAFQFADSDRVTPTAGRKLSMAEQLLGNVGKFNANDLAGGSTIGSHAPGGISGVGGGPASY